MRWYLNHQVYIDFVANSNISKKKSLISNFSYVEIIKRGLDNPDDIDKIAHKEELQELEE